MQHSAERRNFCGRAIRYTAPEPPKSHRGAPDVPTLCCGAGDHCCRLAGRRHLPHLAGEDQGRLPGCRAVAAGPGAGVDVAHVVDWRRISVCRGRECIQERVRGAVAAGGRMAGSAADLLHCAAGTKVRAVHSAGSAGGPLQPDRPCTGNHRNSLCLHRDHELPVQGRRRCFAPYLSDRGDIATGHLHHRGFCHCDHGAGRHVFGGIHGRGDR